MPDQPRTGVLPSQEIREAIAAGQITAGRFAFETGQVQPASLDLRLGEVAYSLRCSFLPDRQTVLEKLADYRLATLDLRDGAILERGRPYLIPLMEELRLPIGRRARANPKSSTGRADVFTRVITDRSYRFDDVAAGYTGKMYLEVVPRSFAIRVQTHLRLNQLRLFDGPSDVHDDKLRRYHVEQPLVYIGKKPLPYSELALEDGVLLGVDLIGNSDGVVGYRARQNSRVLDMTKRGTHAPEDFWEEVRSEAKHRLVLDVEQFYLFVSQEAVRIPPDFASEMVAYDPTSGELRTHYAGFFDPGFGWDRDGKLRGTRAVLEVRAHDVPFMIEHGQKVFKLAFERMKERPSILYGEDLGSSYQGQGLQLGKHFATPTVHQPGLPGLFDS